MDELVPLPVLLPLFAVGAKFIIGPRRARLQGVISTLVLIADTVISIVLLVGADRHGPLVIEIGGYGAPLGITLVVDRLSGLMIAVSSVVTLAVLFYSQSQGSDEDAGTPLAVFYPAYLIMVAGVADTFLANPDIDRELYRRQFHLNENEVALVANLIPKQQFLIKTPELAKIANLNVDPTSYWLYTNDPYDNKKRKEAFETFGFEKGLEVLAGGRR